MEFNPFEPDYDLANKKIIKGLKTQSNDEFKTHSFYCSLIEQYIKKVNFESHVFWLPIGCSVNKIGNDHFLTARRSVDGQKFCKYITLSDFTATGVFARGVLKNKISQILLFHEKFRKIKQENVRTNLLADLQKSKLFWEFEKCSPLQEMRVTTQCFIRSNITKEVILNLLPDCDQPKIAISLFTNDLMVVARKLALLNYNYHYAQKLYVSNDIHSYTAHSEEAVINDDKYLEFLNHSIIHLNKLIKTNYKSYIKEHGIQNISFNSMTKSFKITHSGECFVNDSEIAIIVSSLRTFSIKKYDAFIESASNLAFVLMHKYCEKKEAHEEIKDTKPLISETAHPTTGAVGIKLVADKKRSCLALVAYLNYDKTLNKYATRIFSLAKREIKEAYELACKEHDLCYNYKRTSKQKLIEIESIKSHIKEQLPAELENNFFLTEQIKDAKPTGKKLRRLTFKKLELKTHSPKHSHLSIQKNKSISNLKIDAMNKSLNTINSRSKPIKFLLDPCSTKNYVYISACYKCKSDANITTNKNHFTITCSCSKRNYTDMSIAQACMNWGLSNASVFNFEELDIRYGKCKYLYSSLKPIQEFLTSQILLEKSNNRINEASQKLGLPTLDTMSDKQFMSLETHVKIISLLVKISYKQRYQRYNKLKKR